MSQFETLTAPILAGTQANWALLGTLAVQVYKFHICFAKERAAIKALVYSLFLLEVVQTGITSHFAYSILVTGWGNPNIFVKLPWSSLATPIFTGITSASVQIFFAWRIYFLKGEKMVYRGICITIVLLALMQSLAAIISDARFAVTTEVAEIQRLMSGVKTWLIGSAICDVLISLTMVVILTEYRMKTPWKRTDSLITKLIFNTVETGAITTVVAIADVVLFITFPSNNLHQTPAFMLGKLYSNLLLVTLNARTSTSTSTGTSSGSRAANISGENNNHELQWRRQTNQDSEARKVHITTVTEVTNDSDRKVYAGAAL
ncbi:hypothetical protein B0H17DRAFT_1089656 [Mycena rosella]|uniref:DUF6534 domain-containing protein n=1 Tax=Mycena rosella TaxID=1033263 RepID=A0AAD7G4T7_MYCRO|nr:hypothetical protein B0H17DRAFT_1089656 [Mycena rosella]